MLRIISFNLPNLLKKKSQFKKTAPSPSKENASRPVPVKKLRVGTSRTTFNNFNFADFGGDAVDDDSFFDVTNDKINAWDKDYDNISTSSLDEDVEEVEAHDLALELNLPTTDYAINDVGYQYVLNSWIDAKWNELEDTHKAEYEKLSSDIDRSQKLIESGIENIFRYFNSDEMLIISDAFVNFGRELLKQFVTIVLNQASTLCSYRDQSNGHLSAFDAVEALRSLGRNVYYSNFSDLMEDDDDDLKESYFDKFVIVEMIDICKGNEIIDPEVSDIMLSCFNDLFYEIVSNAVTLRINYKSSHSISVEDLKMVIELWKSSPCGERGFNLIQRLKL